MSANSPGGPPLAFTGSTAPTHVVPVAVAKDNNGNLTPLNVDSSGNLKTSVTGAGSGGTSSVDESAFTEATTAGTGIMAVFNDALTAVASGLIALARMTAFRALHINLRNNSGTEIGTLANAVRVDPVGTTSQPVKLQDGSGNAITSTGGALNISGSFTATPPVSSTSTSPAQTTVGTAASQVLAANASRKRVMLQNVGVTVIKISLGAVNPTATAFHFALPAGGTADDGSSPLYSDNLWQGAVQAISSAAGGLLVVTELT